MGLFGKSEKPAIKLDEISGKQTLPPMPGTTRTGVYRGEVTLDQLKPGECGIVKCLNGLSINKLRLMEMGLTPGTHLKVVRTAAFGGPMEVIVRGYQLSLRREEAKSILLGDT